MKEAIQKYIEELEHRVKYLKIGLTEYALTDYIKQNTGDIKAIMWEINTTLTTLKSIVGDDDKKPHSQNTHLDSERPLIENSTIDTEENKSENWRLTKYP